MCAATSGIHSTASSLQQRYGGDGRVRKEEEGEREAVWLNGSALFYAGSCQGGGGKKSTLVIL